MGSAAVHIRSEAPPPQQQQQAEADKPKGPTAEEFASLQRELAEVRESAEVWKGLATRTTPAPQRQEEEAAGPVDSDIDWGKDEDPTDDPSDVTAEALLDDLSKTGLAALQKHGFVRKSDVVKIAREESRKAAATAAKQVVHRARTEVTAESEIMKEFPDLADNKSELFKLTSEHVRRAVKLNPAAANNPATLYLAAQAAQAKLDAKGGNRGNDQQDDDFEDDEPAPPRRSGRQEHIAAQHGDRGRGRSAVDGTESLSLNEDELSVARALGIDPKDYKAQKAQLQRQGGGRGRR